MAHEAHARTLVSRVRTLTPGIYTADSDTDGYGSLMAAVDGGDARLLGEYDVEPGVRSVAVEVDHVIDATTKDNPAPTAPRFLRIGEEFYTKALVDYRPWEEMWFREAIQNAVDAGIQKHGQDGWTNVTIRVDEQPDGTTIVSCEDDGGGMDEATLFDKFLTLGPSGKTGHAGATGGFGEAKRLLLLPWLSYEIRTREHLVQGKFASQELHHEVFAESLDGTKLTVRMPADRKISHLQAVGVIERCYLPKVLFTVNGERVRADLSDGDEVDAFSSDKARLHYKPRARKKRGFFVRKNGLFMFEKNISTSIPGYFTLEITAPSTAVLTGSRMSFHSWSLEESVDKYLRTLAVDSMSATKKKRNIIKKKWRGSGKFQAKAEEQGALKALIHQAIGASERVTDRENVDKIMGILADRSKKRTAEEDDRSGSATLPKPDVVAETEQTGPSARVVPTVPIIPVDPSSASPPPSDVDAPGSDVVSTMPTGYRELEPGESVPVNLDMLMRYLRVTEPRPNSIWRAVDSPKPNEPTKPVHDVEVIGEDDGEDATSARPTFEVLPSVAEFAVEAMSDRGFKGPEQVEAIIQQVTWEPDFYVENTIEEYRVPRKFTPDGMTPTLRKLAKFWASCCCMLLAAIESRASYGIGWIFSEEWDHETSSQSATKGEYVRDDGGEEWLMLNPFRGGSIATGDLYSLRNDDDLRIIHAIALHEVTHLVGYHGHDERFASALTKNVARAALTLQELKKIRDAVAKRDPGEKKAKPAVKVKLVPEAEKRVKEAESTFKKHDYERFYLPSYEDRPRVWKIERLYEGKAGFWKSTISYENVGNLGTTKVAETSAMADGADVPLVIARLRAVIAKYRPDLIVPSKEATPEDLRMAMRELEDKLAESVRTGRDYATVYYGDRRVYVELSNQGGGKWAVSASVSLVHVASGEMFKTRGPSIAPRTDEDYAEEVARLAMKKVEPAIVAKLLRMEK